jgi:hypothetical protein
LKENPEFRKEKLKTTERTSQSHNELPNERKSKEKHTYEMKTFPKK